MFRMAGDRLVSVGLRILHGMRGRAAGRQRSGMHPEDRGASLFFGRSLSESGFSGLKWIFRMADDRLVSVG